MFATPAKTFDPHRGTVRHVFRSLSGQFPSGSPSKAKTDISENVDLFISSLSMSKKGGVTPLLLH